MKEVLFKFETKGQASEFVRWFSEYGQYYYMDGLEESNEEFYCPNVEIDFENNIINLEK